MFIISSSSSRGSSSRSRVVIVVEVGAALAGGVDDPEARLPFTAPRPFKKVSYRCYAYSVVIISGSSSCCCSSCSITTHNY